MRMFIRGLIVILVCCVVFPTGGHSEELKPLTQQLCDSAVGKWLTVWGDYGFNLGASSLETGTSYSNQLNFGIRGTPAKILTLDMSMTYLYGNEFGNMSSYVPLNTPENDYLKMHRAYATLDLFDKRLRLSGGRRPLGESTPLSRLQNKDQIDDRGNSSLLSSFYFDGGAISYAPENLSFLGSYWQLMYGHGYGSDSLSTESSFLGSTNSLFDSDIVGTTLVPVNTDGIKVWLQWNRAFDLFDFPEMNNTVFGNIPPSAELGDIDWFSMGAKSIFKTSDFGDLHFFVEGSMSVTRPNHNVSSNAGFQGLLSGAFFAQDFNPQEKTGFAVFTGIRYDLPTKTKIGFEYNYGSKYWITTDTTSGGKNGTRGNVYEPFIIQEINLKPVTSIFTKTFLRAGYQYYDFEYTGSNNWVGAPVKISDIRPTDLLLMAPIRSAQTVYGALEIHF